MTDDEYGLTEFAEEFEDRDGLSAREITEEVCGKNVVHEARLRELIDDWRRKADVLYSAHKRNNIDVLAEVSQIEMLANELEALIGVNND